MKFLLDASVYLTARSARRVGACIITDNEGDFELIGRWIPIEVLRASDLLAL